MKNNDGRVRNYVVSNKEAFCEVLGKTLCKLQVQYVQVENEFHFSDMIYRFYSFDECLEVKESVNFVNTFDDKIVSLDPQSLLFARREDEIANLFRASQEAQIVRLPDITIDVSKKKGASYTKKRMQHDNRLMNQKLKNSYNMKKGIKRFT